MLGAALFLGSIGTPHAFRVLRSRSQSMVAKASTAARASDKSDFKPVLPPVAKKVVEKVHFGVNPSLNGQFRGDAAMNPPMVREDPYFWLRDETRKDPDVIGHLQAENDYCSYQLKYLNGFSDKLYKEMLSRLKETDVEVPHQHGEFLYYSRTEQGKSYKIHCRKPLAGGEEVVILDENKLAEGKEHADMGSYSPSPSHTMLAYSMDFTGYETYSLHIVSDIASGKELSDVIEGCSGDFVWGTDESSLFYATMDEEHRPDKLFLHVLGTPQSEDVCVFSETDNRYWMHVSKTANENFLTVGSDSKETSENFAIDLRGVKGGAAHLEAATKGLKLVQKRQQGVRYEVEQHGDHFYVISNADGAKNNKLVRCLIGDIAGEDQTPGKRVPWEDVRPYNPAEQIDDVEVFTNHLAVFGRQKGVQCLWIVPLTNGGASTSADLSQWISVPFAEVAYSIWAGSNFVFDSEVLRLTYSSFVTPKQVLDYNMRTGVTTVLKQQEVPGYDMTQYECKRIEAPSHDGSRMIPMTVVYNKKVLRSPSTAGKTDAGTSVATPSIVNQPTLLYGYGSYGICIDAGFDFKLTTLLDYGVVYAVAHIRGGGEMGRGWYEDEGKYLTKRNTFNDFAASARHLISLGMTGSDRLACVGRSAGGLLVGATVNMYPELFKVAVADVPFVDVMNTMSDPTIPLTVTEWEEWGNPNEAKYHDYMLSYSPYDNVEAKAYPSMLVTAGLNDPRVAYWEPAKWVAKLRELKTNDNPLYFKTDLSSGHFSASDRYKYIRERAFEYAFILDQIGAKVSLL